MTSSKQTVALALTGAVALASGAYALGSQAGNGDAAAAKSSRSQVAPYGPGPGFGADHDRGRPSLTGLAARLGVKEADLRKALDELRPAQRPLRDDLAQPLADALGIDVSKVTAAFDKVRPRHEAREHRDLAAALAKQLGVSTAKVQQALDAQPDRHGGSPDALAKALGVSPAKLRQAFATLRPGHPEHGTEKRHADGPATAALAKELGVTQAKLTAAFEKLRAAKEKEFAARRDAFAKQLADKLGLDVSKVKSALETSRGFRGGP